MTVSSGTLVGLELGVGWQGSGNLVVNGGVVSSGTAYIGYIGGKDLYLGFRPSHITGASGGEFGEIKA